MFFLFNFRRRFLAFSVLCLGFALFMGCSNPAGGTGAGAGDERVTLPSNLYGYHQTAVSYQKGWSGNEWIFTDDGYVITNETVTYYDASTGDIAFAGTIADYVAEDDTNGRLFIRISNGGTWGKTPGSYYAIICRGISSYAVTMGGAYKGGGQNNGVSTLAEAKAEYAYHTALGGYFDSPALYIAKTVAPRDLGALEGTWYYEDYDMYVVIRGNTFLNFMDGADTGYDEKYAPDDDEDDMLSLAGEVVDRVNNTANSGVLYVHTVVASYTYLNDKYVAVAWKKNGNTISVYTHSNEKTSLADLKNALNNANDTSQFTSDGFLDYVKQ
ncbi:MAG: hypothetical protein LBJ31_08510 [Treponema sp.]|jgi:hypothetical protein|nr:hypothetical protein [Treponema sp.]